MIHFREQAKNRTKQLQDLADELLAHCPVECWHFCISFRSVPDQFNCTSMWYARTAYFM